MNWGNFFMAEKFNVIVEKGEDGYLISEVMELPGCHTQAKSYDELMKRKKEAISLDNDNRGSAPITPWIYSAGLSDSQYPAISFINLAIKNSKK